MKILNWQVFSSLILAIQIQFSPVLAANAEEPLARLKILEQTLQAIEKSNRDQGYDIDQFFEIFKNPVEEADSALIEERQKDWYKHQMLWNDLYDDYILMKQSFIMNQTYEKLQTHFAGLNDPVLRNQLEPYYQDAVAQFNLWDAHKNMLGRFAAAKGSESQKLQSKRKAGFYYFFAALKTYHLVSQGSYIEPSDRRIVSVPTSIIKTASLITIGWPFLILSRLSVHQVFKTPLTRTFMALQRSMNRRSEAFSDVKIHGKQFLQLNKDSEKSGRQVNLLSVSHRNDVGDNKLLASIGLSSAIIFGNAAEVGKIADRHSSWLFAKTFASVPEFVSVGAVKGLAGRNPTEKLKKALKSGHGPNVVNYSQGFMADFHEILEISPRFTAKLLKPLLDEGYRVRLVPVSYEIDSQFLRSSGFSGTSYEVIISRPVEPETLQYLVSLELGGSGFDHLISLFLRLNWHESIQVYGELPLSEIAKRILDKTGLDILS